MTKSAPPNVTRSEGARERMRLAALARHNENTQQIGVRVRKIMRLIPEEMAANQGIYPRNKGALSLAEVARRAGVHPVTFHKPRYQELVGEVRVWLNALKADAIVGHKRVQKALDTRRQEWKQLYEDLLESHHISETDLAHATAQVQELEEENARLRQKLADTTKLKVVPLRTKTQ